MSQTSGYAILRMPRALVEAFDLSMRTHQAHDLFQSLCETLKPLPRSAYRGISRFALKALPSTDPEILRIFEETGCDVRTEYAASRRFLELLDEDLPESDFVEDLLSSFSAAQEIFSFLEAPDDYEIVQLTREPFGEDVDCFGFDVGYWGGDHYSIICDSAVLPTWHPPQPESFAELARQLRVVNEHFLFRNAADAARFRSWYRTQYWAETESRPDEFSIIQVNKPRL
jgi:hypothetical protein